MKACNSLNGFRFSNSVIGYLEGEFVVCDKCFKFYILWNRYFLDTMGKYFFLTSHISCYTIPKDHNHMKQNILLILIPILFLTSCTAKESSKKGASMNTFNSVSMDEGLKLMASDRDFVLLDVRTPEEFSSGHIPGALQLTNETFTKEDAENLLKNKGQTIYVYCRSGRRSKQASKKLIDFGYVNVIEIGGIIEYAGPLEK